MLKKHTMNHHLNQEFLMLDQFYLKKDAKIKKGLEYVEEMNELTFLQIENGKNNLIKLKNDLIEKF